MMAPAHLPVLAGFEPRRVLAWRYGQAIDAGRFIGQALALADALPDQGRPINLCVDRLNFAVALTAALLRGQTSLLPPNTLPDTLRQVPVGAGQAYVLTDQSHEQTSGLRIVDVAWHEGVAASPDVPTVPGDLIAFCLLTSGSTGAPQPHAKRWADVVTNIGAEAQRLAAELALPTLDGLTLVSTVPAQHSYGLESSVLLAMLGGAALEAGRPFYPADIVQALARVPRPRALVTTPLHLKTLLLAGLPLPAIDLVLSATAALSPQLATQAEAATGGRLIEIYGCTEAGQVATRRTTEGDVWTCLGALRLGRHAGGEPDEPVFTVSGGHVPEPTPLADRLELIDDRRFRLIGRANDLIHVGGKRSSLSHLNHHLNRIEGVEDGAFWLPDAANGEEVVRMVAFVVAPSLSARQIVDALRGEIEAIFLPRKVVHVVALPREATGKLTAAALRRFALRHWPGDASPDEGEAALSVPADHPAFPGHFPGQPVLPGAALLALVLQTLAGHPALSRAIGPAPRIDKLRFAAPVGPGATLRLCWHHRPAAISFDLSDEGASVASGRIATDAALAPSSATAEAGA